MRIISGTAGGRRLTAPSGEKTRPTSDKIRGSLFNILSFRVADAHVLDLFGGTGALALEALSRGAAHATIVDADRKAIEAVRQNAQAVLGDDAKARTEIIKSDYKRALGAMTGKRFDLVFLDPPYAMTEAYAAALEILKNADMLTEDAIAVCERARDARVEYAAGYEVFDSRVYGETAVDLLRLEK